MRSEEFKKHNLEFIRKMASSRSLHDVSRKWFIESSQYEYSYHFSWLGRPIIQFPQDILAMQEIIWSVKPDLIVETGIARGGSLIFYASLLELIGEGGIVVGIDIDIREENRWEIERHPLFKRIRMIQGSSVDPAVVDEVSVLSKGKGKILVALDSNHIHDHVLSEMKSYSSLVTKDSYLVVFDTIIEDMPEDFSSNRPWGKGNSPATAVREFLSANDRFVPDKEIETKLLITVAPGGYLRCIKD
jgi:cephalosporin hydroxylase